MNQKNKEFKIEARDKAFVIKNDKFVSNNTGILVKIKVSGGANLKDKKTCKISNHHIKTRLLPLKRTRKVKLQDEYKSF
ncbi:hypothetical protein CQA53_02265 [Helicobacter didelphidarum]|uniref:Uncharacterized protein n=1 Tax=Helicobacter didelphidarum TaxID=2040648 RepID=A0A3D8IPB1_9HELI|nr:hypothetical protein [Helicobacter didelphidarum]RDU67098.1 hypothetical protein CQA53_02265 [Helicobacter didelphidarum]